MAVGGVGPASADDDDTDAGAEDPEPEGYPVTPNYVWNAPGWEAFVKIAYVVVAALICNNILYSFFPYGLSSPAAPPALFSCEAGELLVMLSGVLLGAFDFGPQCAKQIRGGLKALDVSVAKQRQAAVNFLGLVLLKIVSDAIGLALLAAPAALVPDWPRDPSARRRAPGQIRLCRKLRRHLRHRRRAETRARQRSRHHRRVRSHARFHGHLRRVRHLQRGAVRRGSLRGALLRGRHLFRVW